MKTKLMLLLTVAAVGCGSDQPAPPGPALNTSGATGSGAGGPTATSTQGSSGSTINGQTTVGSGTVGSGTVGSGTVGSGTVGSGTVGSGTVGSGTNGVASSDAATGTATGTMTSGTGGASSTVATVTSTSSGPTGPCSVPEVRITEVSLDAPVIGSGNEGDTAPIPMALAAKPSGGTTLAWLSSDSSLHIAELDGDDQIVGASFSLSAVDFQDLHVDDTGGVVLLTRDAEGGGTLNCGNPSNLCDGGPNPAIPCYDMYLVRFDGTSESWATKLTDSGPSLPPYSTGPNGPAVNMIWWYQHHGRIAWDGSNWASYFGNAISISEGGCINIHQNDRMQVVNDSGQLVDHPDSFGGGCSHSWNTRIVWDERSGEFVMVCVTDNNNRVRRPPSNDTIVSTPDIGSASVGDLVLGTTGGYWVTVSHQGTLRLLHFDEATPDEDITVAESDFSHLVSYGASNMLVAWESGNGMTAEVRSAADGSAVSSQFSIDVPDHRYQAFKAFPDGSAAYAAEGSNSQSIQVARVMPCDG